MATQPDISLRIGAEFAELRTALQSIGGDIRRFRDQAQRAPAGAGFDQVKKSIDGARSSLALFAKSLITIGAIVGTIRIADQFANMQARLRLVTDSTVEFIAVQERLFAIAQKTGQSFTDITDLYTKLARSTKDLGIGQEQLLQVTETINQTVQLSGVSAESANAALIQLGQGLASGRLSGDELRSVLEQVPVLADTIAKGMGVAVGDLREMGKAGEITAEQVIKALQKQREEINRQAAQLPLTFGRATTQLRNSVTLLIGEFDQASSGTQGLAGAIKDLADFLSSDEVRGAMAETASIWGQSIRQLGQDFKEAIGIINVETDGLVDFLGRAFKELPQNIRAGIQVLTVELASLLDELIVTAQSKWAALKAVFTDDTLDNVQARLDEELARIAGVRREMIDDILAERQRVLALARAAALGPYEGGGAVDIGDGKNNKPGNTRNKFKLPELRKEADESFRLFKDALDRESKALDQALEDRKVSIKEWYAEKQRLAEADHANEKARLEKERQELEGHLARLNSTAASGDDQERKLKEVVKTKNQIAKVNADLLILERNRATVIADITREATQKEEDYRRAIEDTRNALLRAQGQDLEARLNEIKVARDKFITEVAQDSEGIDLANQLFNAETLKARVDEVQKQIGEAFSSYEEEARQMADKVELGVVGQFDAEERLQEVRAKSIAQVQQYIVELEELASQASDIARPEILQKLEAAKIKLAQIKQEQGKLLTDIKDAGKDSLSTFFNDIVEGSKSAGEALRDLARNFASAVGKMASEALAKNIMASLFSGGGGSGGGGGNIVAKAFNWFAGLFHQGGVVGRGGPGRMVSPLVFAGAPRYHSGSGPVGLKPNEVPAILEKGETVRTLEQEAGLKRGGGTRVINVIDPALVEDFMTSSAGEQVVLNTIGRNPGYVKQVLGG